MSGSYSSWGWQPARSDVFDDVKKAQQTIRDEAGYLLEPPQPATQLAESLEWLEEKISLMPKQYEYYIGLHYYRYNIHTRTREVLSITGEFESAWRFHKLLGRPWNSRWVSKDVLLGEWKRMRGYQLKGSNG